MTYPSLWSSAQCSCLWDCTWCDCTRWWRIGCSTVDVYTRGFASPKKKWYKLFKKNPEDYYIRHKLLSILFKGQVFLQGIPLKKLTIPECQTSMLSWWILRSFPRGTGQASSCSRPWPETCDKNLFKQLSFNAPRNQWTQPKIRLRRPNRDLHELSLESWVSCERFQLGQVIQMNSPIIPWNIP